MSVDLDALQSPTPKSRIKKRKGSGGQYLDYVDARFCMDRLDQAVGPMNWRNEYKEVCGHLICGVSIFDTQINDWVTKWDTGTESNFEAEKGHFSDAFKRACVHWGIGRDLYGDVEPAVQTSETSEQVESEENSVGVAGQVTPPPAHIVVGDWKSVKVHFGTNSGKTLGELEPRSLEWYQTTWSGKSNKSNKPSDDDLLLRAALDKSMKKGGTQDGFKR